MESQPSRKPLVEEIQDASPSTVALSGNNASFAVVAENSTGREENCSDNVNNAMDESNEAISRSADDKYVDNGSTKIEAKESNIQKSEGANAKTCNGTLPKSSGGDNLTFADATVDGNAASTSNSLTFLSQTIPRKRRRPEKTIFEGNNEENFTNNHEDEENMTVDISLNQLKRQVLGRDLKVDDGEHKWEDDEVDAEVREIRAMMNASDVDTNENSPLETVDTKENEKKNRAINSDPSTSPNLSSSSSLPEKLRKDLMCAICHEIVYPPVALSCGHSFCQPCIDWWFNHDEGGRCPTCRRRSHNGRQGKSTSPNLALRACVMALYGPEIVLRLQNRQKLKPKGENGGAHNAGYQVLSNLRDETWHYVPIRSDGDDFTNTSNSTATIRVRRSIVLDAEDHRMQLALAIYHKPIKEIRSASSDNSISSGYCERFNVEICMLTMEEDEAVDSGFPTNIVSPEDEFFVCGHHGSSRFLYSSLDVQMKDENGRLSPLARVSADTNDGRFKYVLDPTESAGVASTTSIRALLFDHSETGSQLEIDLAHLQKRASGNNQSIFDRDEACSDRRNFGMERNFDSEESEGENQNEFEEDGFLVGDDESDVHGAFSDGENVSIDEDDRCVICEDGGELMICDGGDRNPGCGRSFHASCVNRPKIPDGDWICQSCAKSAGIETSIIGHEFREPDNIERDKEVLNRDATSGGPCDNSGDDSDQIGTFSDDQKSTDSKNSKAVATEDNSLAQQELECENESDLEPLGKNNKDGKKRRFVLEDSDSD